jgi:predicted ATPase
VAVRLTSLHLANFRGFSDLTLPLDPRLTVLVGQNGSGKSTILDATEGLYRMLMGEKQTWSRGDLSRGSSSTSLTLSYSDGENEVRCFLGLMRGPAGDIQERPWSPFRRPATALPLVSYKMNRSARGETITQSRLIQVYSMKNEPAMQGMFAPMEGVVAWFREREDLENQERVRRRNFDYQDPALVLARRAILGLLGAKYSAPRIDRQPDQTELLIDKDGESLPATQLSDGERSLLVMAGDLARQISQTSADGQVTGEAIVLIDEIELHLHPGWQRRILPAMLQAFPGVQFIVTTHSPQVLGGVEAKSLRILENFRLLEPTHPVKGRDANALLREIMGTSERPAETEQEIKEIGDLLDQSEPAGGSIDRGKLAAATEKIRRLREVLGETDSEIIRLDTALLFAGEHHSPEDDAE